MSGKISACVNTMIKNEVGGRIMSILLRWQAGNKGAKPGKSE
jgi:hypothetical protein